MVFGGALAVFALVFSALYVYLHRECEKLRRDLQAIFDPGDPDQPTPELN